MIEAQVSRRDVLKFSALGAAVVALPLERVVRAKTVSQIAASKLPAPYTLPFAVPPVIDGRGGGVVNLEQTPKKVSIIPGFQTTIFGYGLPGQGPTTPGPTIHAKRGTPLTVMQANKLPTVHPFLNYDPWTSTHLHGSASKPQYDGYASDITKVGQTKRYIYPNKQDARTLWYHDHGVHHTAENAYMGLAAQYHLHDDVESGLSIPKWMWDGRPVADQYDLPLVLADKMFSANGEFRYDDAGHTGLWGDVVLVNGVPWPNLKVKKRLYRFRVLNASISRGYRLQMSNSTPISVIGTDGGLMPQAQQTTQLRIGMAERYEIVIDFSKYAPGTKLQLLNLGVPNWFHPVHIHLVDFKMLTRNGKPVFSYEQGPKDVTFVGENETIRAIMRFGTAGDPSTNGRYMIHCHNLPHEDHDMMTQFRVGADVDRDPAYGPDDPQNANCNDPINADPAGASPA